MSTPTPQLGQVYRSPSGQPAIFVRTEVRPGSKGPEHLFVLTRDRAPFTFWTAELPAEYELVNDTEGRRQANEQSWLRTVAEHDVELLLRLLRQACEWLPRERADELRQRYVSERPVE